MYSEPLANFNPILTVERSRANSCELRCELLVIRPPDSLSCFEKMVRVSTKRYPTQATRTPLHIGPAGSYSEVSSDTAKSLFPAA